jgi:hypothetical protein
MFFAPAEGEASPEREKAATNPLSVENEMERQRVVERDKPQATSSNQPLKRRGDGEKEPNSDPAIERSQIRETAGRCGHR